MHRNGKKVRWTSPEWAITLIHRAAGGLSPREIEEAARQMKELVDGERQIAGIGRRLVANVRYSRRRGTFVVAVRGHRTLYRVPWWEFFWLFQNRSPLPHHRPLATPVWVM
jgi:predicted HAD superfamily phosphohydrolase YqeG